jgi:hypothetical protein
MRLNIGKRELQKCTFNRKVALFTPSEQSPLRQRGITAPHHFDPPVTIARGPAIAFTTSSALKHMGRLR